MLDLFSWSHILVLLIVAIAVVGPKDLPKLMRMIGKWAGKAREMAGMFRANFDEMTREAELDELRKEIQNLRIEHTVGSPAGPAAAAPQARDIPASSTAGKSVP